MKKSFLNVFAVVAILSIALVSCDKTKKAVEEVNENTTEAIQDAGESVSQELDTLQADLDTLKAEAKGEEMPAEEGEAK